MKKSKAATIEVQGTVVSILTGKEGDYISLTDMLRAKDGDFFISDWLRNRNTVEFLGIWESVFNPDFNYGEFAVIKIRVEHRLPDAEKFHGVPVAQPVGDEELAVLCSEHVSEGNVIALLASEDGYDRSSNFNCGGFRFFHGKYWCGHCTIGFQTLRNPSPSKSFTFTVANSVTPCAVMVRAERVS